MDEFLERVSDVSEEVANVPAVLFADDVLLNSENTIRTCKVTARYSNKLDNGQPNELEYKSREE